MPTDLTALSLSHEQAVAALAIQAEVRVVAMALDDLPAELDLLDAVERGRAARFATPQLQRRFIAAHAALRRLLAWASNDDPAALRISADAQGKPVLGDYPHLHFSLSHCAGRALVALGSAPLGVDIEAFIRRDTALLADQILGPAELCRWHSLPPEQQVRALTEAWTGKEALLKACGFGLRVDPVTLELGQGEHVLPGGGRWFLRPLACVPGHAAALAQALPVQPLGLFELKPDRAQGIRLHLLAPSAATA
ncbi:MAG: 4'-phosphopantetheinyl transferase superfamily protein [Aquimonas sp.]|nr:4'-phosphopantetheinyl transferase superfamily protein [Aquimonas sp.]